MKVFRLQLAGVRSQGQTKLMDYWKAMLPINYLSEVFILDSVGKTELYLEDRLNSALD